MKNKFYINIELVNDGYEEYEICSEEDGMVWATVYDRALAQRILEMMNGKEA